VRKKGRDLRRAHVGGMSLIMKPDVSLDPMDVNLLRPVTVVTEPDRVAHPV
jgi:hypothetical protein